MYSRDVTLFACGAHHSVYSARLIILSTLKTVYVSYSSGLHCTIPPFLKKKILRKRLIKVM